jgi:hypothetical protein
MFERNPFLWATWNRLEPQSPPRQVAVLQPLWDRRGPPPPTVESQVANRHIVTMAQESGDEYRGRGPFPATI